jgi:hypothetical protein
VYGIVVLGDTLFAATYNGVFRSVDTGKHWEQINSGLGDTNILCLAVIDENLFAADVTGGGVFRSTDDGANWTSVNNGLPNDPWVYALAVSGSNLFAGVLGGVYLTTNFGNTWENVNQGLEFGEFANYLTVDDNYLFANLSWENDYSVWRRPLSEMIPQNSVAVAPTVFTAELQSYPNPFSQSTTISCTLEAGGYAEVSIVNLLGVEVAHLFSGMLDAGVHSFVWNSMHNIPDGAYECIVRMNGTVNKLPMTLLR